MQHRHFTSDEPVEEKMLKQFISTKNIDYTVGFSRFVIQFIITS